MKNTLFLFLFLLFASILHSQNFSFSINGGINASYLKFESSSPVFPQNSPWASKPGFMVGVDGKFNISPSIALRLGTNYLRKGAVNELNFTDENGSPIGTGDVQINIDYLTIPFLVEASFLENNILFFNVGYSFDFMQKAETKFDYGNIPRTTVDETDNYTKVDYSFLVGMGVQVPISEHLSWVFEGRLQNGLTDINKSEIISFKNRTVFAATGVRLKI